MKALILRGKTLYATTRHDKLYLNALFGIASSVVVAAGGFAFWLVTARLYTTLDIGLATAIIAALTLLVHVSNLGLDSGLIRFLPKSNNKSQIITSSFLIIALAASVLTALFLLAAPLVTPNLTFLRDSPQAVLLTVLSLVAAALSYTLESVFLAFRNAQFTALKNLLANVLKIALLFLLLPFGAFGIFLSWTIGIALSLFVSIRILQVKFSYSFSPHIVLTPIKQMASFSGVNYVIGFLGLLPTFLIPLFITSLLSAQENAYYYIAMMIANLLYFIPFATTQSLFAEGSHDTDNLRVHIIKSLKLTTLTLLPAITITYLFGDYVLLFFGADYARESFQLLQILALAAIPVSGNYLFLTICNITRRLKTLLIVNTIGATTITILSFLLLSRSLEYVGVAWLIGQITMNCAYTIALSPLFRKLLKKETKK